MAGPGGKEAGRVSIKVLPDTSEFGKKLRADMAKIEKRVKVEIPVLLDTKRTLADARRAALQIGKELDGIAASPKLEIQGAKKAAAEIAKTTRDRTINVRLNLVKSSVAALTGAIAALSGAQYLRPILQNINMDTLQLVQVATALGTALVSAAGALAALAPAAILAAGAVGGVLALAFSNITDSAVPAVRQLRSAVESLKPAFNDIRASVQAAFFQGLGPQVRQLGEKYVPVLRTGLTGVASALNVVAKEAAAGLLNPTAILNTSIILRNVKSALEAFAPTIRNIILAFSDLGAVGSSFLPRIAEAASAATGRFREFIAEARKSGQLKDFISAGLSTLNQLGRIAKNAATAIGGIVKAIQAAGGSAALGAIEDATAALSKFLNSAKGQNLITQLFRDLNVGISAVSDGIKAAGPAIQGLVGVLGTALSQVGIVLGTLLETLGPALEPLMPVINQLVTALGGVLASALRTLAGPLKIVTTALANALAPVIPVLADAFLQMHAAMAPVITALAEGMAQAITAIAPFLPQIVQAVLQLALSFAELLVALAPLIPPLTNLVMTIFMSMIQYLPQVIGFIASLVSWFAGLVAAVAPAVASFLNFVTGIWTGSTNINKWIGDMVTKVKTWLSDMGAKFAEWRTKLGDAITTAVGYVKALPGRVWGAITKFASDMRAKFTEAANTAKAKAQELVDKAVSFLKQLPGKALAQITTFKNNVVNGVKSAATNATTAARNGFNNMVKAIKEKAQSAVTTAKELPGKIKSGLGNLANLLFNAGKDVVRGLANGIRNMAGEAQAAARRVADSVKSTIKNALRINSPSKLMIQYGQWTSEGLAIGIENQIPKVVRAADAMASAAVPASQLASDPATGKGGAAGPGAQSGVTINQTVNPAQGMSERGLANESLRLIAFAMKR